jgi:hypothetical protein
MSMPGVAFMLHGRVLSDGELAALRRQVKEFDRIDVIALEMRALIEQAFPDLAHKLPPLPKNQS